MGGRGIVSGTLLSKSNNTIFCFIKSFNIEIKKFIQCTSTTQVKSNLLYITLFPSFLPTNV